jgi:hypothetical protein
MAKTLTRFDERMVSLLRAISERIEHGEAGMASISIPHPLKAPRPAIKDGRVQAHGSAMVSIRLELSVWGEDTQEFLDNINGHLDVSWE